MPSTTSVSDSIPEQRTGLKYSHLQGKRVAIVVLSAYPFDPRPRRTADALVRQGMVVDYICVTDRKTPWHDKTNGLTVFRVPMEHQRRGKLAYACEYSAFTLASALMVAVRSFPRGYDLIYINNMPDMLVLSALLPKILGAKVILDLHDPMPELMTTVFQSDPGSKIVRLLKCFEKWSVARADQLVVPNKAMRRLLAGRSCPEKKIAVMMNSPDESIFPFRSACSRPAGPNSDKPFVVMYHGTLVERNGLGLALDAFASVCKKLPRSRLHIYGQETPFLESVMRSARERGLRQNVLYFGERPLERIVGAIDACDLGVIPSRRSAFTDIATPTRIFEYLARGKPVIAPHTAGIQDYFDESSLLFFRSGDADDLAQKIEFAAFHPSETLAITERGQRVYKRHAWKRERETLLSVVAKLLKSPRSDQRNDND